jgi:hypothetical protein
VNARPVLLLSLTALLAAAAAACGATGATTAGATAGKAAPTTPRSPRELLLSSLDSLETGSVRFAATGDQPMAGVLDATRKSLQIDMAQKVEGTGITLSMKFLFVGKQSWVKIAFTGGADRSGLPKLPKKWMLLDPSKLAKGEDAIPDGFDEETDPGEVGTIVEAAGAVRQTSPGHFAGTTDLTQAGQGDIAAEKTVAALGAKAKAVPFEATTDDHGRLRSLLVKIPAAGKTKASAYGVSYRDYGTAPSPARPGPGEQQKAPAVVYEMLNG